MKLCPKLYCFSRVSEGTLGTFWARFWRVLGTKLGGVSAFRVLAMSRTVAADVQATGRDRTVITKAGKRYFFPMVPCFRRDVPHFLGSILALFRPSGPLRFPVIEGAFSASGGRAAAATGATGGFYVLLYKQ